MTQCALRWLSSSEAGARACKACRRFPEVIAHWNAAHGPAGDLEPGFVAITQEHGNLREPTSTCDGAEGPACRCVCRDCQTEWIVQQWQAVGYLKVERLVVDRQRLRRWGKNQAKDAECSAQRTTDADWALYCQWRTETFGKVDRLVHETAGTECLAEILREARKKRANAADASCREESVMHAAVADVLFELVAALSRTLNEFSSD